MEFVHGYVVCCFYNLDYQIIYNNDILTICSYHSSQSRIAYNDHQYLIIFWTNYTNNTIKYKETYIFLNKNNLYLIYS